LATATNGQRIMTKDCMSCHCWWWSLCCIHCIRDSAFE